MCALALSIITRFCRKFLRGCRAERRSSKARALPPFSSATIETRPNSTFNAPTPYTRQTSFLAHPGKAAVTSMAVEKRSESVLLTGSAEGEVRVWSLREHPVSRLSGFRSGESGASGGSGGAKSNGHAAITQLGVFEGAGRAAALDGLVRIWDVERWGSHWLGLSMAFGFGAGGRALLRCGVVRLAYVGLGPRGWGGWCGAADPVLFCDG